MGIWCKICTEDETGDNVKQLETNVEYTGENKWVKSPSETQAGEERNQYTVDQNLLEVSSVQRASVFECLPDLSVSDCVW